IKHQEARAPAYGRLPPAGPAPRDHAFEFHARNEAPVSVAPGGIMDGRNSFGIAFPRISYGYDRFDHSAMLRPLGPPPQELFRTFLHLLRGHCGKNTITPSRDRDHLPKSCLNAAPCPDPGGSTDAAAGSPQGGMLGDGLWRLGFDRANRFNIRPPASVGPLN